MKRLIYWWVFVLIARASVYSQDVIMIDGQPCGMTGTATQKSFKDLDVLKNRYNLPASSDFDQEHHTGPDAQTWSR